MRRLLPRRVRLRAELRSRVRLPGEPPGQVQTGRPAGVRGHRPVPALGRLRRRLPGGSLAPRRGQEQLSDRREPGEEGQDSERPVPAPCAPAGGDRAQRHGSRRNQRQGLVLEELRVFRGLVPLREAGVQNRGGDTDREAAVQVKTALLREEEPRVGVSVPGGRDHGEAQERPDRQRRRDAGAGQPSECHARPQRGALRKLMGLSWT